jgi:hypothetical protein
LSNVSAEEVGIEASMMLLVKVETVVKSHTCSEHMKILFSDMDRNTDGTCKEKLITIVVHLLSDTLYKSGGEGRWCQ